ncbi:MAG TPA: nitroreductase family protein [Acidimicrobiia bacterium]|nr:nitroreductase family protein [Acidimicrobiia bacterium]
METFDAIRSRRNVRQYQDRPIADDALTQILEAARRTPSSKNEQRWDLIVVRDPDRLQRLSEVWQGARHIPGSAATIALVGPDPDEQRVRESVAYDMGQLTMSVMLAAADLGIGTGHSSAHDQDVARAVLELPDDRRCWWLIGLGYPADRPLSPIRQPDRRALDDLVHHETW